MKTIVTKYVPPTNTRGSKIKATETDGKSVTVDMDYSLNTEEQHAAAAKALKDKLGWSGKMVGGNLKDGYVFVFQDTPLKVNPVRKLPKRKTKTLPKTPCQLAAKKLRKNPIDTGKRYNLIFQKRIINTHPSRELAQATKTAYIKQGYRPADFSIKVSQLSNKPVKKPVIEKRYHVQARSSVGAGIGWKNLASFPFTNQGKKDATEYANAYYESKNGDVYVQVIT